MLVYCNNLLSSSKILHDKMNDKNYLLIHKNGSSSLEKLARRNPSRYTIHNDTFLNSTTNTEIIVFVREPIERFKSGLRTQISLLGLPPKITLSQINDKEIINFFDLHTTPQFWVLLSLAKKYSVIFKILPLNDINNVDDNMYHENKGLNSSVKLTFTDLALLRLEHFYTEDTVLYYQFLNSTTTIDEIINKIKLEKNFVNDLSQYKQVLTYLF